MKVLVTGANGQLGFALQKTQAVFANHSELELISLTRAEMDLAELDSIDQILNRYLPDAVINAAAYTAVDKAETEAHLAELINSNAVRTLAQWCEKNKKIFIHVSTDFVFDGTKSSPYEVTDKINPLGVYGKTKRYGEQAALAECATAYVVRTGWVYGEHGTNFAKTILRLASEREQLGIVSDQVGTPTYATHLAEMLWQLLKVKPQQKLWHFSDAGVASWYDFAVAIVEQAEVFSLLPRKPFIKPIATQDYPTPAQRPAFSVLSKKATWNDLHVTPIHWREALNKMLSALASA